MHVVYVCYCSLSGRAPDQGFLAYYPLNLENGSKQRYGMPAHVDSTEGQVRFAHRQAVIVEGTHLIRGVHDITATDFYLAGRSEPLRLQGPGDEGLATSDIADGSVRDPLTGAAVLHAVPVHDGAGTYSEPRKTPRPLRPPLSATRMGMLLSSFFWSPAAHTSVPFLPRLVPWVPRMYCV